MGELFFAPGKQRDRGHIKYDKGAVRRRGEKESLTADGLWLTGCSGTKENGQGAIPLVGKKKMPYKHSGGEHTDSIARRRRAQEGTFYKKSPLDSLKNFYTALAKLSLCVPN